jgi:hypothetical protein
MALGLLGRELSAADELRDERMVLRELLELAVANPVRARVSDVTDPDDALLDEGKGHRRAHSGDGRVLGLAVVDAPVRFLDQLFDPLLAAAAAVA